MSQRRNARRGRAAERNAVRERESMAQWPLPGLPGGPPLLRPPAPPPESRVIMPTSQVVLPAWVAEREQARHEYLASPFHYFIKSYYARKWGLPL